MPFVHIMTTRSYFPPETETLDDARHRAVVTMAQDLPKIFLANAQELGINPDETPIEGVQVTFGAYHPRSINVPNLGFYVLFTEPKPPKYIGSHVTKKLWDIVAEATKVPALGSPRLSLDVFWGDSHGFLKFGDAWATW